MCWWVGVCLNVGVCVRCKCVGVFMCGYCVWLGVSLLLVQYSVLVGIVRVCVYNVDCSCTFACCTSVCNISCIVCLLCVRFTVFQ